MIDEATATRTVTRVGCNLYRIGSVPLLVQAMLH